MYCLNLNYTGFPDATIIERMNDKVDEAGTNLTEDYATFEKNLVLQQPFYYDTNMMLACDGNHDADRYAAYWYHPDHLGSSSYITNLAGEITQHMEYLPFGELLVEEHLNSYNSPFKFNAKEFDAETGNYYMSARYYNPKWSIWLSVDPLAEEREWISPYNFVQNNPIMRIDPTGMLDTHYEDEFGKTIVETNDGNDATVVIAGDNVKAFQEDFNNTSVMHQDGAAKNAEWISKYGEGMVAQGGATVQPWAIGALGHDVDYSGVAFAAAGLTLSVGESALEGTTFRLFNNKGTNFSPKLYRSGWRGGSAGQIKTYGGASKGFGFAGKALGWYGVGNAGLDLIQGKTTGVQGIADIGFGIIGTLGGKAGAIISLSYELGKIAGPSKWYGSDDTKWFK